jgi:regulator of sirC expression with transglutaminase-like and TPR domain
MIGCHISISCIFIIALVCAVPMAYAAQQTPEKDALNRFLALPDDQIDLGKVKLTFDRFIDPSINVEAADLKLNAMVAAVSRMVAEVVPPGKETAMHKMLGLRTYLYDPGYWNEQKIFRYDFKDPLGSNTRHKLLPYLDTRQGNCVSMPILFVILGQRLGIDVSLSLAPLHILVTFTDEKGVTQYLETTSGARPARKEWLNKEFNITDAAIDNGLYLQKLNKKEMVAVIGATLLEHAMKQGDYDKAVGISNVMLSAHPNNIQAMLTKATTAGLIMERDYVKKYPRPSDIPPEQYWWYEILASTNQSLFIKAERLGWRQPTPEQENRYLESVRQFAQSQKMH